MTTFDRVLESLAFCHVQDEHLWAAARIIVQQDVDEVVRDAGPALAGQLDALSRLMTEFEAKFPGETDPVLIRSYMRRHIRRIEYELKRNGDRPERQDDAPELTDAPATSPEPQPPWRTPTSDRKTPRIARTKFRQRCSLTTWACIGPHRQRLILPSSLNCRIACTVSPGTR
jgi:hypothetical protein